MKFIRWSFTDEDSGILHYQGLFRCTKEEDGMKKCLRMCTKDEQELIDWSLKSFKELVNNISIKE